MGSRGSSGFWVRRPLHSRLGQGVAARSDDQPPPHSPLRGAQNKQQTHPTQKPPRTPAQIAASRANGAKSKGPVTPEGKSISARNAERHGFFSQLATIKGESPQEYVQVSTDLYETWQPTDEYERCLVDTML